MINKESAKPILFNTEMVREILGGRKTVTRRAIKPQTVTQNTLNGQITINLNDFMMANIEHTEKLCIACAPYQVGDILYVRETWGDYDGKATFYTYKADYQDGANGYWFEPEQVNWCDLPKWKPSIHMPKSAARIFLKVTDVRVERLQDITEEQARAEGCYYGALFEGGNDDEIMARPEFISLWNSTIKKVDLDTYGWSANPWVWVIEFEVVEE